ncbi:MAG: DUF1707 domain-containing protein [Actinomycetota bacterium]|nr:DUF1707 domain-containing protein [Acidimicrobiia bacterium]MDQ3293363.1 DUF1707 domain-containing protein [Actinomycetota bacterium]
MAVEKWDVRVGDQEREACVEDLRTHFAVGRLTLDEFEERTTSALAARVQADLANLTADLPALRRAPSGAPVRQLTPRQLDNWDIAFRIHVGIWAVLSLFFVLLGVVTWGAWPVYPILGIGVTVGIHAAIRAAVRPPS